MDFFHSTPQQECLQVKHFQFHLLEGDQDFNLQPHSGEMSTLQRQKWVQFGIDSPTTQFYYKESKGKFQSTLLCIQKWSCETLSQPSHLLLHGIEWATMIIKGTRYDTKKNDNYFFCKKLPRYSETKVNYCIQSLHLDEIIRQTKITHS